MTTIVWDGKELVADSRMTELTLDKHDMVMYGNILRQSDTLDKIVELNTFTIGMDRVLAVGVAGDARVAAALKALDRQTQYNGKQIVKDFTRETFYTQWGDLTCDTHLIVIGRTKFMVIEMARYIEDGQNMVGHRKSLFARDREPQWAMIGSGLLAVQTAIRAQNDAGVTEISLEEMQTKSARKCVQFGIMCDKYSGGPLKVWTPEKKGLEVVECDPIVTAVKQATDEGFDFTTMCFDDSAITARVNEIIAQHEAEKAVTA
jgi:hypothetical protein